MVSSLRTGFEELENELKDLIEHSSQDMNMRLVNERKKIQSTKELLKNVLIKELDSGDDLSKKTRFAEIDTSV